MGCVLNDAIKTPPQQVRIFELFAGIGGFSVAGRELGCVTVAASEIDEPARAVFADNFPEATLLGNLACHTEEELSNLPDADILTGGFPCQPYSRAGKQRGMADHRGAPMFDIILRVLRAKRPRALLLENVQALRRNMPDTLRTYVDALREVGYEVLVQSINSNKLVPQYRHRVYIIGFRNDLGIHLLEQTSDEEFVAVPSLDRTVAEILERDAPSSFNLSADQVSTWDSYESFPSPWFERWIAPDMQSGCCMKGYREFENREIQYGCYVAEPGKCKRFWTPGEFHRLQGFPDTFRWCTNDWESWKQAGNAVSPPVAALLLGAMLDFLEAPPGQADHSFIYLTPRGNDAAFSLVKKSLQQGDVLPDIVQRQCNETMHYVALKRREIMKRRLLERFQSAPPACNQYFAHNNLGDVYTVAHNLAFSAPATIKFSLKQCAHKRARPLAGDDPDFLAWFECLLVDLHAFNVENNPKRRRLDIDDRCSNDDSCDDGHDEDYDGDRDGDDDLLVMGMAPENNHCAAMFKKAVAQALSECHGTSGAQQYNPQLLTPLCNQDDEKQSVYPKSFDSKTQDEDMVTSIVSQTCRPALTEQQPKLWLWQQDHLLHQDQERHQQMEQQPKHPQRSYSRLLVKRHREESDGAMFGRLEALRDEWEVEAQRSRKGEGLESLR